MVSEFDDPEDVKGRGCEKLAALRAAIREGLDSGPAEPFDIEVILAEAHGVEAWRKERKFNPSRNA